MLGNYLQQTTSADDSFRCIFFWCFKGLHFILRHKKHKKRKHGDLDDVHTTDRKDGQSDKAAHGE